MHECMNLFTNLVGKLVDDSHLSYLYCAICITTQLAKDKIACYWITPCLVHFCLFGVFGYMVISMCIR